jgi:hypothetical protein
VARTGIPPLSYAQVAKRISSQNFGGTSYNCKQAKCQFVETVINKKLAEEDVTGAKTLLGLLATSVDPETEQKLSYQTLRANSLNILSIHDLLC